MNTVTFAGKKLTPSKVVCVGRNYVAHIQELGNEVPDEMVVFLKPNSAIGNVLFSHSGGEPLHYEGELAFMVTGGRFTAVAFGLDLTRRTLQSRLKDKGLPWERAKAFDGAALFSEFVPLPASPDDLELSLRVDGEPRQQGGVSLMMYRPEAILKELQSFLSLEDGDIVMTGTPAGVGEVRTGETFTGSVAANGETLITASWVAR